MLSWRVIAQTHKACRSTCSTRRDKLWKLMIYIYHQIYIYMTLCDYIWLFLIIYIYTYIYIYVIYMIERIAEHEPIVRMVEWFQEVFVFSHQNFPTEHLRSRNKQLRFPTAQARSAALAVKRLRESLIHLWIQKSCHLWGCNGWTPTISWPPILGSHGFPKVPDFPWFNPQHLPSSPRFLKTPPWDGRDAWHPWPWPLAWPLWCLCVSVGCRRVRRVRRVRVRVRKVPDPRWVDRSKPMTLRIFTPWIPTIWWRNFRPWPKPPSDAVWPCESPCRSGWLCFSQPLREEKAGLLNHPHIGKRWRPNMWSLLTSYKYV